MSGRRDELIAALAGSAAPVRRAAPPAMRAAAWLAITALAAAISIHGAASTEALARRLTNGWSYLELLATAATGIAAIVAAFQMGVPGSSPRWPWRPLVPLALWMAASIAVLAFGTRGAGSTHGSLGCFRFVLIASVPMGIAVLVALRRTRALRPWRTACVGGLGVASLAAFLLAFCHPFALNPADLGMHLAAILIVLGVMTIVGGPILNIPRGRWRSPTTR